MACRVWRVLALSVCVFIVSTFLGCDGPQTSGKTGNTEDSIPWPGGLYNPKLPSGLETLDAVKQDLADLLTGPRNPGIKYYSRPDLNRVSEEASLKGLVEGSKSNAITFWYRGDELLYMAFSSIASFHDRIEVSPRMAFFYADLAGMEVVAKKTNENPSMGRHIVGDGTELKWKFPLPFKIDFPGLMAFLFEKQIDAERFADDLHFIQQIQKKILAERLARFESRAAQYRDMAVKPQMSQEQRRYIVQADVLATQMKDYAGAIDLYLKAIDLDPVSHPEAYINLAMLSAQQKRYQSAIAYMRQYLRLVPDAQNAQDKIYEWELLMQK